MREAGTPRDGYPSSAEVNIIAAASRASTMGVPASASGHTQAEITAPGGYIVDAPNMDTMPVFQAPEASRVAPVQDVERVGSTAVGQAVESQSPEGIKPRRSISVPPAVFRPAEFVTGDETATDSPESITEPTADHAEDTSSDSEAATARYASGQARDIIRQARSMLEQKGISLSTVLGEDKAGAAEALASDKSNADVCGDLGFIEETSVPRLARVIVERLRDSSDLENVLPRDMFTPAGASEQKPLDPDSFAVGLREVRESLDMTQQEFADTHGMSLSSLVRYENGHVLPLVALVEEVLTNAGVDPERKAALAQRLADARSQRQEERRQANTGNDALTAQRFSSTREELKALHDNGTDLRDIITNSGLSMNDRTNLHAIVDSGLLGEATFQQVADTAGVSISTLHRNLKRLVDDIRDDSPGVLRTVHENGVPLEVAVEKSGLPSTSKQVLRTALGHGLFTDKSLEQVAEDTGIPQSKLRRVSHQLAQQMRNSGHYDDVLPPVPTSPEAPQKEAFNGVGARFGKLRPEGLTNEERAAQLGISPSALMRLHSGKAHPHISVVKRYAEILVREGNLTPEQAAAELASYNEE
jgi:transcriptional regulator with XRE-family HTH domain